MNRISIHALLAESDGKPKALKSRRCVFLSTLSLRRATAGVNSMLTLIQNFYPRSPCGERRSKRINRNIANSISIHALLAESDHAPSQHPCPHNISIHALLAESDTNRDVAKRTTDIFLSTLSLRRATIRKRQIIPVIEDFYPRSPCGERPFNICVHHTTKNISIHALLAESDS